MHKKEGGHPVIICIIGPTASGKGTQAKMLASTLHIPQVTISHVLRDACSDTSREGEKMRTLVKRGAVISANVIKPFLKKAIEEFHGTDVVFDGFPRTVEQAELLTSLLPAMQRLVVVELQLPDKEIYERIKHRLGQPGYVPQIDDNREIVEDKMLLYNASKLLIAKKILHTLNAQQKVNYVQIDGSKDPHEVHTAIVKFVKRDLETVSKGGS